MKQYHAPELVFELLQVRDVLTASGVVTTVGPTTGTNPTDPTGVTGPTEPTDATSSAGGIVLPEDTFG